MNADIFFKLSSVAQCCISLDLQFLRWNHAFEQLTGIQVLKTHSLLKFIPYPSHQEIKSMLTSLPKGETLESGFYLVTATDKQVLVFWKIHAGEDSILYLSEQPQSIAIKRKDTTLSTEKFPEISKESLISLLDHSDDMIARFDRQLRYTFVNQGFLNQTRHTAPEQFLGKTTIEMAALLGVSKDNFTPWTNDLQQALDTGSALMHYDHLNLPSHTLHFQTKIFPEFTSGAITGVLVITRINNELKKSEEKLTEQKNLLKLVFDCMQEGVMVVDTDLNFIITNKTARTVIPIELSTKNYEEWATQVESFYPDKKTILPPDELPAIQALRGETVYDHLGYYKHRKTKEGVFLSMNSSPLTDANGKLIGSVTVFNNVTERIRTQEQMAYSLTTLNSVIESTQDLVVAISNNYTVLTVNSPGRESFLISTGKTIEKGHNLLELLIDMPDLAEGVKRSWFRALQGETYVMMHEMKTPQKNTRYFESVYSPMYNQNGEVIGATMIGRDVTLKLQHEKEIKELLDRLLHLNQQFEEKNKELLAGEEKLKTQQEELHKTVEELASRNFELDQLVYKTSHDIRSPLTSILGLANVMKADPDTTQWPLYLNHIENRVLTLDRFVHSMINYAKANRNIVQAQLVDFHALLEQTKHDLAYMKGFENIEITLEYTGESVAFYGDLFRLQILFNNIISNAIKYQNVYAENHYLRLCINLSPTQAELTFTDNGIGIKEEHIARIFDMFYRATEHTDGSGLGLYIVKQTVEKMKGRISLKSQYGKMTQFIVVLPNSSQDQ